MYTKDYFREQRIKAGLTQKELAELFDISTRCVQNYEAGARRPRNYILEKYAALQEKVAEHKPAYQTNAELRLLYVKVKNIESRLKSALEDAQNLIQELEVSIREEQ